MIPSDFRYKVQLSDPNTSDGAGTGMQKCN